MFRRFVAYFVMAAGLTLGIGSTPAAENAQAPANLETLLAEISAEQPQAGQPDRAQAVNRLAGRDVPEDIATALQYTQQRWQAQANAIVTRLAEKHRETVRTSTELRDLRRRALVMIVLQPTDDDAAWQRIVETQIEAIREHICKPLETQLTSETDLGRILTVLEEMDGYMRMLGLTDKDAPTPANRLRERFCRAALLGEIEQQVLHQNRRLAEELSEDERLCVELLNDYRMLLGLHPLKIDMRLVRACRKYAAECAAENHYSHAGSLPGRKTRDQRAAQEGYPAHVAENLAFGRAIDTGRDAFNEWFRSMPHHRVMINRRHALRARGEETVWKYPRYYTVGVGHADGGRYSNNWCLLLGTGHPLGDDVARAAEVEASTTTEQ
jgi:uncharacterized protein YkwD